MRYDIPAGIGELADRQAVRYGWRDVYGHPCETALLQAQILRRRGWPGTPRPCPATCPVGRDTRGRMDLPRL